MFVVEMLYYGYSENYNINMDTKAKGFWSNSHGISIRR